MEVIDVHRIDERVHRGVYRRRGSTSAVKAEVERADHLVLTLLARVHVHQGAHAVEPKDGEALWVSVPRSPPEPFTHSTSTG